MKKLNTKTFGLVVTGGVAAYKACELVRLARKDGFRVRVIMTKAAQKFVHARTFQALSGEEVAGSLWQHQSPDAMDHIRIAESLDVLAVAPCSANFLGRLAHGLANDLASTTVIAFRGPVFLAPAMNVHMYANPIVQKNIAALKVAGYRFLGPNAGEMACGHVGLGRMLEPIDLWSDISHDVEKRGALSGKRILVTAGPTQEPLDAVRYLTNPSSGKMGYAIAQAAADRGAEVILVSGPTTLNAPQGVETIAVRTAQDMHDACLAHADVDFVFMAAAVGDFRFAKVSKEKESKETFAEPISLVRNPDILSSLVAEKKRSGRHHQVVVGFSMETRNVSARTRDKMDRKGATWMVANDLSQQDAGFQVDTNRVTIFGPDGFEETWGVMSKRNIAEKLLDLTTGLRLVQNARARIHEK